MQRVGRIAEREIERDGEEDDGDRVLARRNERSERDADEAADRLDVQRGRHDVGEPIPAAALASPSSPHSGLAARPARAASQPSSARRAAPLSKIPCRYVPVTVPVAIGRAVAILDRRSSARDDGERPGDPRVDAGA